MADRAAGTKTPPKTETLLKTHVPRGNRPAAFVVAGHNGSGKSTMWYDRLAGKLEIPLVNADRLMTSILPPPDPRTSQLPTWARNLRDKDKDWMQLSQNGVTAYIELIKQAKKPFAFETVFSHWKDNGDGTFESKTDLIEGLQKAGYFVVLLFVGLVSADMSVLRVSTRVQKGGHDVDVEKLMQRFPRTQRAIGHAAPIADMTLMFDNSGTVDEAFTLVRAQKKKSVLFDCRDDGYKVPVNTRKSAALWLDKVVPLA